MSFQFHPLDHQQFSHLYGLSDQALADKGVLTCRADQPGSFPCRVSLKLPEQGERMLLLNYQHLDVDSPYRSAHAIYIRDGQHSCHYAPGQVPAMLQNRRVAIRALCSRHRIVAAELVQGDERELRDCIEQLLATPEADYLHLHSATHGCYLARVSRSRSLIKG